MHWARCSPVFQGTLLHLQEEFSSDFSVFHIRWLQTVLSSSGWINPASSASPSISLRKPEVCLGLAWWPSARLTRTLLRSCLHCGLPYWTQYSRSDLKSQLEGKNPLPQPDGYTLANTAQHVQTAFFVARAHCTLQPVLNQKHKALSTKVISSKSEPIQSCCLFHPKQGILHLPCFIRFLSAHLSILSRSHSKAAQPSSTLTAPTKLLSSMDLLRMQQNHLLN